MVGQPAGCRIRVRPERNRGGPGPGPSNRYRCDSAMCGRSDDDADTGLARLVAM